MKTIYANRAVAASAIGLGCAWGLMGLIDPTLGLGKEGMSGVDRLNCILMFPITMAPAVLALYFGIGLARNVTKRNIKGTVGMLAFFGAFPLVAGFSHFPLPERVVLGVALFIATGLMICVYTFASRTLMVKNGMSSDRLAQLVDKGVIAILAVELWLIMQPVMAMCVRRAEGLSHSREALWTAIGFAGSILVPWLFYRVSVRILGNTEAEPAPAADAAPPGPPTSPPSAQHS